VQKRQGSQLTDELPSSQVSPRDGPGSRATRTTSRRPGPASRKRERKSWRSRKPAVPEPKAAAAARRCGRAARQTVTSLSRVPGCAYRARERSGDKLCTCRGEDEQRKRRYAYSTTLDRARETAGQLAAVAERNQTAVGRFAVIRKGAAKHRKLDGSAPPAV